MLKALIVIVAVVIAMSLMGWLSFSNSNDSAGVTLDKQKVQHDTEEAVEKVQDFSEDVGDKLNRSVRTEEATPEVEPDDRVRLIDPVPVPVP